MAIAESKSEEIAVLGGDRRRTARLVIWLLVGGLALAAFLSLSIGATGFTPGAAWEAIWASLRGASGNEAALRDTIILDIRLPRTLLGIIIGAALAVSGVVLQGLFRNPLADPGLVGVSSGAGLAAVIVIIGIPIFLPETARLIGPYALPVAAFFGALITTTLLYRIATRAGRTSVATMLLAGIALGALAGALTGYLTYLSDDQQLRDLTFWTMGSLGGATMEKVLISAPFILVALISIPWLADRLDALLLGEAEAGHLGVEVQTVKRLAIVIVALSVGASVAAAGPIGFIGIVVPHLLRLGIGPRHRALLIGSALLGAILLIGADIVSRTAVAPAELPIGIVTALIGAPFFLWLLLRRRSLVDL
ncbi:FecCD family ABC transporter permease [Rhodoligotrophos defluvii]|uniref:FecCD family ABC transporter permease n=1 Tax=Rhodoligotrophos defluvii TaxID=2561934 RepID=UPI0010C9DAC0|nr:iron chelate uptake ABC transporter family permease subunit [Rhodoligotrophos defluvii]